VTSVGTSPADPSTAMLHTAQDEGPRAAAFQAMLRARKDLATGRYKDPSEFSEAENDQLISAALAAQSEHRQLRSSNAVCPPPGPVSAPSGDTTASSPSVTRTASGASGAVGQSSKGRAPTAPTAAPVSTASVVVKNPAANQGRQVYKPDRYKWDRSKFEVCPHFGHKDCISCEQGWH